MNRTVACAWLMTIALSACRSGTRGTASANIKPIFLKALPGEAAAAYQCGAHGWDCKPLANGDPIAAGRLLKTSVGGRAGFEVDAATTFDLGGDAEVLVADEKTIEAHRGSLILRELGGAGHGGAGVRLRMAGRTAEVDARFGADFSVRVKDPSQGTLTVERGRVTLQGSGGEATVVLSGETVALASGKPPERVASPLTLPRTTPLVLAEPRPTPPPPMPQRGLGTMTARVPGQTAVVSGVELVSHHVEVAVRDGFARTEIDEVFRNDTAQVLEGRYVFPLPTDASVSRLTLWVADKPVEGEIVEKKRAATVFHSIVEDTVRPRDPALLEWVAGGDFSLKIFPLPAKGTRRVRIAYDQALPESGGRVAYSYPLGVGAERATGIADFSLHLHATETRARIEDPEIAGYPANIKRAGGELDLEYHAQSVRPADDFVVTYARQHDEQAELSVYVPGLGDPKRLGLDGAALGAEGQPYFALKFAPQIPASGFELPHPRQDRVILVDTSHGQSSDTLSGSVRIAMGLVRQMDPDERFAVLLCDSACASYPDTGLAPAGDAASVQALERFTEARLPSGSSDLAGALVTALARLDQGRIGSAPEVGQIVYLGDGAPSSGELSADTISTRVRGALAGRTIDTRLLGVGRSVDDVTLASVARQIGATYESVQTGGSLDQRIAELSVALRSPVLANPRLELPNNFADVYPATLPNLRLGQQVVLVGRTQTPAAGATDSVEVRVRGTVAGQPYTFNFPIRETRNASQQNPLVPRLWAQARIEDLEARSDAINVPVILDVSKRYHVMSRYTSLLVLENDAMYSEFGIRRTAAPGSLSDLAANDGNAPALEAPAASALGLAPRRPTVPDQGLASESNDVGKGRRQEAQPFGRDTDLLGHASAPEKASAAGPSTKDDKEAARPSAPMPAPTFAPPSAAAAKPRSAEQAPAPAAEPPLAPAPQFAQPPAEIANNPSPQREDGESAGAPERRKRSASSSGYAWAAPANDLSHPMAGSGSGSLSSLGGIGPTSAHVREGGSVEVYGSLSVEAVSRATHGAWGRIRLCYQEGVNRDPTLRGTLVLGFTVDLGGAVVSPYIASGTLADATVRTCVVRSLLGISFPASERGATSVRYPLMFQAESEAVARTDVYRPRPPVPTGPTATHSPATDAWMAQGEDSLSRLRAALGQSPESRKRFEELVRGLLANGRFSEAFATAQRFASLDPDSSIAQELLSYAAVANGNARLAVASVDNQTETDPRNAKWHARAARAFEAVYDERRACAHWRSLAELKPSAEEFVYQALRCRARVLGDRSRSLAEARSFAKPGKLMGSLIGSLESGTVEPYDRGTASAGSLEVEVSCPSSAALPRAGILTGAPMDLRCPAPIVVAPNGTVFSPFTPTDARSGARSVAISRVHEGTYRTLLVGGSGDSEGATLSLRALGSTRNFKLSAAASLGATARTIAMTRIAQPPTPRYELSPPGALAVDF